MNTRKMNLLAVLLWAALPGCAEFPTDPLGPDTQVTVTPVTTPTVATKQTFLLSVRDPKGDQTGSIDVYGMLMVFDTTFGEYTIYLLAEQGRPFLGSFRVNINLLNADLGTFKQDPAFFSHTMFDYNLSTPQTMLKIIGWNNRLRKWKAGNRVFTNSLRYTPNPEGVTLFRSAVGAPGGGFLSDEDTIGWEDWAQPSNVRVCPTKNVTPATVLTEAECSQLL